MPRRHENIRTNIDLSDFIYEYKISNSEKILKIISEDKKIVINCELIKQTSFNDPNLLPNNLYSKYESLKFIPIEWEKIIVHLEYSTFEVEQSNFIVIFNGKDLLINFT